MRSKPGPRVIGFFSTVGQEVANRRLDGVVRYVDEHDDLAVRDFRYHIQVDVERSPAPPWIGLADGVIVCIGVRGSAELLGQWLARGNAPVISLVRDWSYRSIPIVDTDSAAAIKLAAEYLVEQGYKHVAYVGNGLNPTGTAARRQKFDRVLAAHGFQATFAYDLMFEPSGGAEDFEDVLREKGLIALLRTAPKPVAIFAQNDNFARAICSLCERMKFEVPRDVAILGSGNFATSRLNVPALSTVQTANEQVGYDAARLLHGLMDGGPRPTKTTLVKPLRIIERQSTRANVPRQDPIQFACDYIRDHACEGMNIDDVVRQLSISRRTFETQFAERMQQSPKQMIQQVRLDRARHLLANTQLSITQVAMMTGFSAVSSLTTFMRSLTGLTPSRIRDQGTKKRSR